MAYKPVPYKQPRTVHETRTLSQMDARATKSRAEYHLYAHSTPATRAKTGYDRAFRDAFINSARLHILGGKWLHYDQKRKPTFRRVLGIYHKHPMEIAPGEFMMRTGWRKSRRTSGFHKRIKPRKHRFKRQTHWRVTGHFIVPR